MWCSYLFIQQVLDSKGIRQAVQEKNPFKAINSFAIRDIIDGVDSPMIILEAYISVGIEVSAIFLVIGVTGKLTARVGEFRMECTFMAWLLALHRLSTDNIMCTYIAEIDLYDPYPETSGGLVRCFNDHILSSCTFFVIIIIFLQVRPFELLALGR